MKKKLLAFLLTLVMAINICVSVVNAAESEKGANEGTYNGHTYRVFDESLSWLDARKKCEELGGHLVIIDSENENDFVSELIKDCEKNLYWIGCFADGNTNIWKWIDNSPLNYDNWSYKEPNDTDGTEMYGHMFRFDYTMYDAGSDDHNAGEWNDLNNTGEEGTYGGYTLDKIGYICEFDNVFTSFGSEISEWASDEIEEAYDKEIIPEILVGEDLTKPITRAEFAAVSVKAYELLANTQTLPAVNNPFIDTNDIEVLKAYNVGITTGVSETEFAPDFLLNREQAATMLTRVFKRATVKGWTIETDKDFKLDYKKGQTFSDDEKISDWAKDSVYFMAANNIINGVGNNNFAPKNITSEEEAKGYANATREQALIIATRMVKNLK